MGRILFKVSNKQVEIKNQVLLCVVLSMDEIDFENLRYTNQIQKSFLGTYYLPKREGKSFLWSRLKVLCVVS